MNKLNNMRIIVVAVCVIAFLALLCRSDNRIAPIIAEQSNSTIGAEVDNLSTNLKLKNYIDENPTILSISFKLIVGLIGYPTCILNQIVISHSMPT